MNKNDCTDQAPNSIRNNYESENLHISSFSLAKQNEVLKQELTQAIEKVIDRGAFILGENVQALESELASYCDAAYSIGVANGSDALYLALLACNVGPEDEVITTPFTFFATAGAISRVGAKPVFADIDCKTWNIDPDSLETKITACTKAIIPVHLYGCPADMDPILSLARKHGLKVIEDAAQAIGSEYKGKRIGSLGDVGCLSFFPTKNLGAFGDGGMVVTNDPEIADRVRILRVHGAKPKYHHHILGCNSRLDELQAAILRIKMPYLEHWTTQRRVIALQYDSLLEDLPVTLRNTSDETFRLPVESLQTRHVYHQYTIQTTRRNELQAHLKNKGIDTVVYYPVPMHLQPVFTFLGYKPGDFPISEKAAREVLSLPMFPELTNEEVERTAKAIRQFFNT